MNIIIECTLVFLFPIFLAFLFNSFFRKNKKANMKIVYYKIFTFMLILYIASQVIVHCPVKRTYIVRIIGDAFLSILIFELFLLPDETSESSDIIMIHQFVFWIVVALLLFNCVFFHFKDIDMRTDTEWKDIKLYRIDKVFRKISKQFSVYPDFNSVYDGTNIKIYDQLPICNLFGCIKNIIPNIPENIPSDVK